MCVVISMQLKLKNYLNGMHGRMELLKRMWQKEHHSMVMTLAKNKSKSSKKQKEFLAKVRGIPDSIKDEMLKIYLEKCKQ